MAVHYRVSLGGLKKDADYFQRVFLVALRYDQRRDAER
jgi:hypothetical protein